MYIRVWQDLDVEDIKKHLMVWGQLSGDCANCKSIGISLDTHKCPSCGTEFKYIAFRTEVKVGYIERIKRKRSDLVFIEWRDFSYQLSKSKAKDLL